MVVFSVISLLLFFSIQESICLRIVQVVVPNYRMKGDSALLECQYELQKDTLYSVKWYKDNEEFYRFVPKMSPTQRSYNGIDGVKVENYLSNDKKVMLKSLSLKSSGTYKCEVSAEAPGFSSASGEGRLEVIYPPKEGPFINGLSEEYRVGDILMLNCTSGKSYPVSVLRWYINDEWISSQPELIEYETTTHQHGLETATLGLRLFVGPQHLRGGALRARCVASAPWPSSSSTLGSPEPLTGDREALLLVKSGCSSFNFMSAFQLFLWSSLCFYYENLYISAVF